MNICVFFFIIISQFSQICTFIVSIISLKERHFDFNILHGASVYLCGNLRDLINDTIFIFILKLS